MNEWISVDDRLPDYLEDVLTWDGEYCGVCSLEFISKERFFWAPSEAYVSSYDMAAVTVASNPTHWMPLPEPPVVKVS